MAAMAIATAFTVLGGTPGYAQAPQTTQAAPILAINETVKVVAPSGRAPFEMKECYEGDRGCQLMTCVSTLTQNRTVAVCQSHGNTFP